MRTISILLSLLFVSYAGMVSAAAPPGNVSVLPAMDTVVNGGFLQGADLEQSLFLAGTDTGNKGKDDPEPGTLVIPGEEKDKSEKKCLNICRKWGEDCIINPRTGARNCRKTCKDFGMECF